MRRAIVRLICTILPVCLVLAPLHANAGLIGTDQVPPASSSRSAVAAALVELGVEPEAARERSNALTDHEARELAAMIHDAPAGAHVGTAFVVFALIVLLVWFYTQR